MSKMTFLNRGNNMWECPNCGEINDDDVEDCEFCGCSPDVNYGWVGENC